jgi:hypothetical protein
MALDFCMEEETGKIFLEKKNKVIKAHSCAAKR